MNRFEIILGKGRRTRWSKSIILEKMDSKIVRKFQRQNPIAPVEKRKKDFNPEYHGELENDLYNIWAEPNPEDFQDLKDALAKRDERKMIIFEGVHYRVNRNGDAFKI